jgi:ABC-type multidrug transport system ATPase subunit
MRTHVAAVFHTLPLVALLAGSGKTTLLNALLNRVPLASGSVTVNHQYTARDISDMKLVAFVPQDDTMLHMLTVRDLLSHAALTRLPGEMSHAEKMRRVQRTMALLGLTHIADIAVGNDLERGVSGGEKKRVSIGIELVSDPLILFLDGESASLCGV